jgi:hypothetical protein
MLRARTLQLRDSIAARFFHIPAFRARCSHEQDFYRPRILFDKAGKDLPRLTGKTSLVRRRLDEIIGWQAGGKIGPLFGPDHEYQGIGIIGQRGGEIYIHKVFGLSAVFQARTTKDDKAKTGHWLGADITLSVSGYTCAMAKAIAMGVISLFSVKRADKHGLDDCSHAGQMQ